MHKSVRGVATVLFVGVLVLVALVLTDGATGGSQQTLHRPSLGPSRDGTSLHNDGLDFQSVPRAATRVTSELRYRARRLASGMKPRALQDIFLVLASVLALGQALAPRRVHTCITPVRGPPVASST